MERSERMTAASAPTRELSGSYIDWPAILAGTVVASAIAALSAGFGAALGLSAISAEPGEGSGTVALVITGLWLVLTMVASYMAGGYVAGRMRRRLDQSTAEEVSSQDGINGLVVWGLGMLIGAWMLSSVAVGTANVAGNVAGTAVDAAGSTIQAAGTAVGGVAQGVAQAAGAMVPEEARENPVSYVNDTLLRPVDATGTTGDNAELARQTSGILGNLLTTGEISDQERAYLTSAVATRTGLPQQEVEARVNEAVEQTQAARAEAERVATEAKAEADRLVEEAKQKAIDAAETARISAILTAFAVTASALVAGAAAVIGAVRGGRHRDEGRMFGGFSYR